MHERARYYEPTAYDMAELWRENRAQLSQDLLRERVVSTD